MTEFNHDRRRNLLTRKIISFRKVGQKYRRAEETHIQRLYKATQLAHDLRQVGFRVQILKSYGGFPLPKARAALLAGKPF